MSGDVIFCQMKRTLLTKLIQINSSRLESDDGKFASDSPFNV
jgi:hypothetical protein